MAQCVNTALKSSSRLHRPGEMGLCLSEHASVCMSVLVCIPPSAHCKSALVGLYGNIATLEGLQQMSLPVSFCA